MNPQYARQYAYRLRQRPDLATPPAERPCQDCGKPRGRSNYNARVCEPCRVVRARAPAKRYRTGNPEKVKAWARKSYRIRRQRPEVVEQDRARHRRLFAERPAHVRLQSRLSKFGLTLAAFDAMWERQNGACALCLVPFPATEEERYARREPQIDHDHATGRVRGLLCRTCNMRLGALERLSPEWIERLRHYISTGSDAQRAAAVIEEVLAG